MKLVLIHVNYTKPCQSITDDANISRNSYHDCIHAGYLTAWVCTVGKSILTQSHCKCRVSTFHYDSLTTMVTTMKAVNVVEANPGNNTIRNLFAI